MAKSRRVRDGLRSLGVSHDEENISAKCVRSPEVVVNKSKSVSYIRVLFNDFHSEASQGLGIPANG